MLRKGRQRRPGIDRKARSFRIDPVHEGDVRLTTETTAARRHAPLRSTCLRNLWLTCTVLAVVGCTPTGDLASTTPNIAANTPGTTVSLTRGAAQSFAPENKSKAERSTALATRNNATARAEKRRADRARRIARQRRLAGLDTRDVERKVSSRAGRKASIPVRKRTRLSGLPGVRKLAKVDGAAVKRAARGAARKAVKAIEKPVRVAAAATIGRIGAHGLRLQTPRVSVSCLPQKLVKSIKSAERHFGRPAVVTSGYRSPRHNRRIGGAKNSMHVRCLAADVQMAGVSKWALATYFRQQPGRGGVGTYCHTTAVHVDLGPQRDWNWRCRRRRK